MHLGNGDYACKHTGTRIATIFVRLHNYLYACMIMYVAPQCKAIAEILATIAILTSASM